VRLICIIYYEMALVRTDNNGTGWGDYYEAGDSAADTVDYVVGTQSVSVTTQTLNTFAGIYNEVSFNLSGRNIKIYVKSPDWSKVSHCVLILGSDSWTLSDTVTLDIGTRLQNPPDDEWIEIVVPRSAFEVYGSPDWGAIDMALFRIKDNNSSYATVKLDSISSFSEGSGGMVSITFDDGYDDVYDTAKTILDNKDFVATAFIIPSLLGDSGYLTQTEVDSLHSGGWDISGHSDKKLTTLTSGELTTEISSLKTYFSSKNYRGRNLFAFPYGAWNQDVIDEIEGFFTRGFNIDGWNNPLNNLSSFRINRQSVDKWTTTTMIKGWIDAAKDNGEWCILNFHTLVSTLVDSQDFLTSDFTTIINYLDSEEITVLPISEALSFLYNSSGRNLYLLGYDTGNSERGLYLSAFDYGNAERSLYLTGSTTDSGERNLYLSGIYTSSAEFSLYLEGKTAGSSERALYTEVVNTGSSSRNMYVPVDGGNYSDRYMYLSGKDTGSSDRDIYSIGSILESSERSLYTKGISTSSSERLVYSVGALSADSDRLIYSSGVDTASSERDIYSVGGGITDSERLLYSSGNEVGSSDRLLHSKGIATSSSDRNIYTIGESSSDSDRLVYSSGRVLDSSDRLIYTEGVDTDNTSERNIYTKGVGSTSSERLIYTTGSLVVDSDRLVYSSGKEEASSERTLYTKSGTTSNRFKRWNGSAWVEATVKRYNGSGWVSAKVKHYSGSTWEEIN
jgi:peptidoglycan/xylan/chitin deacetylase (PgdA/CDA1 family)